MKVIIDTQILKEEDFTLQEFAIILYYYAGGTKILDKKFCKYLHELEFLEETPNGYKFQEDKEAKIKTWMEKSSKNLEPMDRFVTLAESMQEEFPKGKKAGTAQYWRDNTRTIALRLSKFVEKYGDYPDEDFIKAAKDYVASFNGNYSYMQLLKYFIYKKDLTTGDENSQLASYLTNINQGPAQDEDWTTNLI